MSNLSKVNHLVVLMLENRSFDHMLGYLSLPSRDTRRREDIDGLTGTESNFDSAGRIHEPKHLAAHHVFKPSPAHDSKSVAVQMGAANGGFVCDFERRDAATPERVMGYYNDTDLPVLDFLADNYCVCDRWFSSVPGPTFPNRLYSLCGTSNGHRDNRTPPIYNMPSFVRQLDANNATWRWYYHDFIMLRLIDQRYGGQALNDENYRKIDRLAADAKEGRLPAFTWIEPNYYMISSKQSNDDHPPSDITAGQRLMKRVYDALRAGSAWDRTALIITYDEHGGFFDHVHPDPVAYPAAPDRPGFEQYGVRVPAIIVSPLVEKRSVCHTVFDHTSIVRSALKRFCTNLNTGQTASINPRVDAAADIGAALTRTAARPAADSPLSAPQPLQADAAAFAAAPPDEPNDLQTALQDARDELALAGLEEMRALGVRVAPPMPPALGDSAGTQAVPKRRVVEERLVQARAAYRRKDSVSASRLIKEALVLIEAETP